MSALIRKELRLAMHPAAVSFLLLSALLLVPNYPYYVTFFYTALGVFFICMGGRENKDIEFSLLLPVGKRDVVFVRFFTVILLEVSQFLLAIPFAVIRSHLPVPPNAVGIEANIAFFGLSFLLLGVFHLVFFEIYYKNTQKVGKAFIWGSAAMFLFITAAETAVHAVPFCRDCLDTADPLFWKEKLAVLAIGILGYALLTLFAYRRAVGHFEKMDL